MRPSVVRSGSLLEEMCGDASRVAAAMLIFRGVLLSATTGGDIILHAYQPVAVMVVRNNRYHQHDHADEYQKICDVPFILHSSFLNCGQR